MTKKDYIIIANALASVRPRTPARRHVWLNVVESIATALAAENERFNVVKFSEACEHYENANADGSPLAGASS